MTNELDKQIIIDGVDVSGCKYFCKFTTICRNENIGRVVRPRCKNVADCYYKQLKRAKNQIVDLNKMVEAKEQECNKLYIQLKTDEEYHKEEENTLRKIIKNKEERNIELYKENNKLKQTLIEIKFWARELLKRTGQVVPYEIKQILQIISEAVKE